ncbi:MAG: SurA N-terminal domain-containing protein, partial [Nitrospinota bacterium]|nr:SurA N-terminal domain-containing protein [Nitrospinota bacterium]
MGGVALLAIGSGPAFAEIVDKIVANVNGSIILLSDVKKQYEALREMKARGQIDMADEDISERKILDTIIDEKILAAHAKERDMEIKESEIDNTIKGIQERNNLDDESFRQILKNQGSSMAEFRERVKNQILTQRVVSLEVDMVNPTEEEAREYYET